MGRRLNPNFEYVIKDGNVSHELQPTTCERDLGVYVDSNLTFSEHITTQTKKARRLCGLIMRTISYKSPDIMTPLFKSLIRPLMEYANIVWAPYLRKHIDELESVQRC